jgi:hypothetical protein
MTPIVVPAPIGLAVDTSVKLRDTAVLDSLQAHGYQGIIRYVSLPGVDPSADIDPTELERILVHPARFWSAWVQHPRFPGWRPRDCHPESDAMAACDHAHQAGYGNGVTGYVDLEGMSLDTTPEEAIEYAMRWLLITRDQGFKAGCYWGYQQPIPPQDRGTLGAETHWSDAGMRSVVGRGCAIHQGQQFSLYGIPFDPNTVRADSFGDTPTVMRAAE